MYVILSGCTFLDVNSVSNPWQRFKCCSDKLFLHLEVDCHMKKPAKHENEIYYENVSKYFIKILSSIILVWLKICGFSTFFFFFDHQFKVHLLNIICNIKLTQWYHLSQFCQVIHKIANYSSTLYFS